jgi:NADH:ubiquinone oxidoreductase subunit E
MCAPKIDSVLKGRRSQPNQLIEVLQDLQEQRGYISEEAMRTVARELGVPLIEVCRVANFYKAFSLKPRGRNTITICTGTACHVRGSDLLIDQVKGQLKIEPGDTTGDGLITVECVNCLGACALGPVTVQNGTYQNHMTPGKLSKAIESVKGGKRKREAADA